MASPSGVWNCPTDDERCTGCHCDLEKGELTMRVDEFEYLVTDANPADIVYTVCLMCAVDAFLKDVFGFES